ncbi:MAG: hypothetical protein LBJ00_17345, partial [Planctomycetaceae bacterium]|nr:hypothetical protein [Planctomycetaceae bacterium]
MTKLFTIVIIFFGLFGITVAGEPEKPKEVLTTLGIFPRDMQVGDTVYLSIQHFNNTESEFNCRYPEYDPVYQQYGDPIRYFVVDGIKKWEFIPYTADIMELDTGPPVPIHIRSGETRLLVARGFCVMGLEDFNDEFWADLIRNLPETGREITFQVELVATANHPFQVIHGKQQLILREKIKLRPRKKKEMAVLENWYKSTPKEMFSTLYAKKIESAYQPVWQRRVLKQHYPSLQKSDIDPKLKYILRKDNRYPTYPNLPEDWQGWKKLEESFEPSTLRDEIRWTRICVQYCVTGDDKVLDELKTWLEKMNPI